MNLSLNANSRAFLILSAATLLAASVSITSTAFADDALRTETIIFQDLNVQTPAGAQVLYRRIRAAATRVCSNSSGNRYDNLRSEECARTATAKGVEQLNLPALSAYYQKITGKKTPALVVKR